MEQRDPLSYALIGAAMEVHREQGPGFLEPVYQESFAVELSLRQISFVRELILPLSYKGHPLVTGYRADFLCYDSIIVELKALTKLTGHEESQVINYLKATGKEVGLLFNFGAPSLEYKRFVRTK